MKSIGERLVAKLKNWRLRKNEPVADDVTGTGELAENNRDEIAQKPQPKQPNTVAAIDPMGSHPDPQVKLSNLDALPAAAENSFIQPNKKAPQAKSAKRPPKANQAEVNKDRIESKNRLKEKAIKLVAPSNISNKGNLDEHDKAVAKGQSRIVKQANGSRESQLLNDGERQNIKKVPPKDTGTPSVIKPLRTQSPKLNQKLVNSYVTDRELDELEAENTRLKLLLLEQSKAK